MKRFTIYDDEVKSVLQLLKKLGNKINEIIDNWGTKTDLYGDHKGSWQGLNKPTLSQEGAFAQVEKNASDIQESGLERVKATGSFISNLTSWIGLVNTKFTEDNATRFYILPKGKVTSGVGGCLKIFGDDYQNNSDYRDLGIYFSADQNGDKGYYNNGVFWINGKVLETGQYLGKNPDIGFSFQDGKIVGGRLTCYGDTRAMWVFGPNLSTLQGIDLIAEFQKDIGFTAQRGLKFVVDAIDTKANTIANDIDNYLKISNVKGEKHYVNGNLITTIEESKIQFEKSLYCNSNVAFNNNENGVILKSPNGSQYRISVNDSGALTTVKMN